MEDPSKLDIEEELDNKIKKFFQSDRKRSNKRAKFNNRYNKKVTFFAYLKIIDFKQKLIYISNSIILQQLGRNIIF